MTIDHGPTGFSKMIKPDKHEKGKFEVGGQTFRNPVKETRIPNYLLDNLRPLATRAFIAESGDSDTSGQSRLDQQMAQMSKKFREEQPEEVWKRTIATIMKQKGVTAEKIATDLFETDEDAFRNLWMGQSPHKILPRIVGAIEIELHKNWPGAPIRR
jgi:hypothetical protein